VTNRLTEAYAERRHVSSNIPASRIGSHSPAAGSQLDSGVTAAEFVHEVDDFDLDTFIPVAANFGHEQFGYVVTPNVDHLIRYREDAAFRGHYQKADYVLLDSRFAAYLLHFVKGVRFRVCTGSDLTAALFSRVVAPTDRIVLIGGSREQADAVTKLYGLQNVRHYNPPMGFAKNLEAVEECLRFIESESPFRFCFLAVGSPQQEAIAQLLRARGIARGLALCIGASLNFITGTEKRAPRWMQQMALEWLYRLAQNPKRLAGRYLVRGPRFFNHLRRARFVVRRTAVTSG
jgi:N-acetylglucosaminyldiphosphoundecaprenol N-acetyl-beta-D-mannosaminyltransferase